MQLSPRTWRLLAAVIGLMIPACTYQEHGPSIFTVWNGAESQESSDDPTLAPLAKELDRLEHHVDKYGTITTKTPAIWGEARLTRHRREFEEQMEAELGQFSVTLNGYLARSDQAYLAHAMALSAAVSGQTAQYLDSNGKPTTPTANTNIPVTTIQANNIIPGAAGTPPAAPPAPGATPVFLTPGQLGTTVYQSQPFLTLPGGTAFGGFAVSNINLEPTVKLDQKARYLNHLHEIRRINEGDDTADSPGYALYLVRVPISVLPGKCTRTGHGAEMTMTINPQYGDELLPKTYRNLVLNDLIDLLGTPAFELAKLKEEAELLFGKAPAAAPTKVTWKLTDKGVVPVGPAPAPLDAPKVVQYKAQVPAKLNTTQKTIVRTLKATSPAFNDSVADSTKTMNEQQKKEALSGLVKLIGEKKAATMATSNLRRTLQAVPPSQLAPIFGDCIEMIADRVKEMSNHTGEFDSHIILDVHKYLSAELSGAYDLLSQNTLEPIWHGELPKLLAEAIRLNDCARVEELRHLFYVQLNGKAPLSAVTTSLAWAVLVESVLLNERLVEDMRTVSTEKGCSCIAGGAWLPFYGPNPPLEARSAFQRYVACRWPIHVFALDPVTQDENIADAFSRRRETQLALALAFSTGNMGASSFSRFSRRLETDMSTISLHRTAIGFTKGENHFGWRFYPRFQTPPIESNLTVLTRDLILGGPTRDQDLHKTQLEPGMRECVALVIMPSFVSNITLDTSSNWFSLTNPKHTSPHLQTTMRLSEAIQRMQSGATKLCDSQRYRPGEGARLLQRVNQLSADLPLQTMHQQVPFENTLGGFAMFTSGMTDLAPQLYGYYGEPGVRLGEETHLILVGNHYSIHETQVIAGNRRCQLQLLSRRIMRVVVPADAQPMVFKETKDDKEIVRRDIDIHVMTPYGVSGHLQVPVVGGQPTSPSFTWSSAREYAVTYTVDKMTAILATNVPLNRKTLLPPVNQLVIDVPTSMAIAASTTATLTITMTEKNRVLKSAAIAAIALQGNRFIITSDLFKTADGDLITALETDLTNFIKSSQTPPAHYALKGQLTIGNVTFDLDSSIVITPRKSP